MKTNSFFSPKRSIIYLNGEICDAQVRLLLSALGRLKGPGRLIINSDGGDEIAMLAMYDLIRAYLSDGGRLSATALGQVQSAATCVYLACDERLTAKHTAFAIHHGTGDVPESPTRELPNLLKEVMRNDEHYMEIISDRTGLSMKRVRAMMTNGHYFGADEAIRLGFATGRLQR